MGVTDSNPYAYTPDGRLASRLWARGIVTAYAYDPIGNRTSATYYDEQGEAVASAYAANALNQYTQRTVPGNVQVRGEADTDAIVTVNENPTWRYPSLGGSAAQTSPRSGATSAQPQLRRKAAETSVEVGGGSASYFYGGDYADNTALPVFKEVEIAAVVPASSPDGWDEMSAVTGRVFVAQNPEQFTYDADGNMLTDGRFRYTWNAENRLVRAQELCAPTNRSPYTVAYAYDHKGRMVSKRITENDGNDTLVKSISYLWDGWNIIRETQWPVTSGQWSVGPLATNHYPLVTDYVWGLDLDGTMQGAGGVGGLLAVIRSDSNSNSNSSLYFLTYDANGNVSEYVTTNGEIVAHYDYSPFGETLIESGDLASTFTHRFSTKPWCPITGLYEYQMRKYRPEIGRWLSRDPIGKKRVFGLYVFVDNSPISKIDDKGLASWLSTRNRRVDSLGCGTFSMSENFQLLSSDNINSDGTIVQNMYIEIKAYYCDGTTMQNSNNSYSEAFATDGANAEDVFTLYFQYDNHCGSYGTVIWEGYATYYDKMPHSSIYDGSENPGWGDFWTIDPVNNPGAGNLPFHSYPFALNTPVPTEGLHRYLKFEWNCCVEEKRFDYSYLSISSRTRKRSD